MVPKSRKKKAPAAMSQKEYKAALRRMDASLKRIDALLKKGKEMDEAIAPKLEELRRFVEDEQGV